MKVVIGICGIGMGHAIRQTPVINFLLNQGAQIIVFSFGEALRYIKKTFPQIPSFDVFVPFIATNKFGVLYEKTAQHSINQSVFFYEHNFGIMQKAFDIFKGKPDFIVSDYEPVSAQFSYTTNSKLITLDQQSKFLMGFFPDIGQYGHKEEADRLRLFFPKADKRYATSFFKVSQGKKEMDVTIIPSFVRKEIEELRVLRSKEKEKDGILVYFSSFIPMKQSSEEIISILAKIKENFTIFTSQPSFLKFKGNLPKNIEIFESTTTTFITKLSKVKAVISTGGHNFLSELMFLNVPVYVCPLANYEQHYSAKIVHDNSFGIASEFIKQDLLNTFIENIDVFQQNIVKDTNVLYKESGVSLLKEILLQ